MRAWEKKDLGKFSSLVFKGNGGNLKKPNEDFYDRPYKLCFREENARERTVPEKPNEKKEKKNRGSAKRNGGKSRFPSFAKGTSREVATKKPTFCASTSRQPPRNRSKMTGTLRK